MSLKREHCWTRSLPSVVADKAYDTIELCEQIAAMGA